MAFDGIVLKSIISELQILNGAKVNRILQPDKNSIIISVYNGNNYAIYIDISASNYRVHLTTHSKANPLVAPNFCMILRKYLINSKITKIYSKGLERIAYIEFETYNEMNDKVTRTLSIELMGKYSNILLLNENFNIIDAVKKFDGNGISRDIMPTRKYILPSSDKIEFSSVSASEFCNIIISSDYKTLEQAIPNLFVGISKLFIQSTIENLKISNTISKDSCLQIHSFISKILDSEFSGIKFKSNYTISSEKNSNDPLQLNFFIDDFYFGKISEEDYLTYRNNLLKILSGTLDKITKKLANINDKIDSCKDMDTYKIYGELLIANIYKFKDIDFSINNINSIKVFNYYTNSDVEISINNSFNISKNAEIYFKKYNKMKNTIEVTKAQKKETEKELDYLESLLYELDNCNNIDEVDDVYKEVSENILFNDVAGISKLKKNKNISKKDNDSELNALKNYIKLNIDDYDVFIGKNNKQNDYLTKRVANEKDYWFHAKDIHGSHLILRSNGVTPKITTITKCAELAAYYSKARFSSHVPVDYTLIKNVKKPNGSVPGYVIYTNNKTLYVEPSSGIQY